MMPKRVASRPGEIASTFLLLLVVGPLIVLAWLARKVSDFTEGR